MTADVTGAAPTDPFASMAILGLGVMGGSLAQALARLDRPPQVVGWSPSAAERNAALADGVLTRVASSAEGAVADVELVVLAAPLGACVTLVPDVLGAMAPHAILTDVASLMGPVRRAVHAAGGLARWVGSHPMCGSEASGYRAADPTLYRASRVWISAEPEASQAMDRVARFWETLGAVPEAIHPSSHDALMSFASHLPQFTANALARAMEDAGLEASMLGPGGLAMTRLAASSPEMWRDIVAHGFHPGLVEVLRTLAQRLHEVADMVEAGDAQGVADFMEHTRTWKAKP